MVGYRDSNGDLYRAASRPKPYDAGGDGGKGLSQVCLERLAYAPCLPEVLRGELAPGAGRQLAGRLAVQERGVRRPACVRACVGGRG